MRVIDVIAESGTAYAVAVERVNGRPAVWHVHTSDDASAKQVSEALPLVPASAEFVESISHLEDWTLGGGPGAECVYLETAL